jgi:hypothetical protein
MKSNFLNGILIVFLYVLPASAVRIDTLTWNNLNPLSSTCPLTVYSDLCAPEDWLVDDIPSLNNESACYKEGKKEFFLSLGSDASLINKLPKRILWRDVEKVIVTFEMNDFACYTEGISENLPKISFDTEFIVNYRNKKIFHTDSVMNGTIWNYKTCVIESMTVSSSREDSIYVINDGFNRNIFMRVVPPNNEVTYEPVAQITKREQISLLRRNGKKHEGKA